MTLNQIRKYETWAFYWFIGSVMLVWVAAVIALPFAMYRVVAGPVAVEQNEPVCKTWRGINFCDDN